MFSHAFREQTQMLMEKVSLFVTQEKRGKGTTGGGDKMQFTMTNRFFIDSSLTFLHIGTEANNCLCNNLISLFLNVLCRVIYT